MQLKEEVRCRNWGTCDIGKRADHTPPYSDALVFPQRLIAAPAGFHDPHFSTDRIAGYELWRWQVYLSIPTARQYSGLKRWSICEGHSKNLLAAWERIFKDEVDSYNAYHDYMDRVERTYDPWHES